MCIFGGGGGPKPVQKLPAPAPVSDEVPVAELPTEQDPTQTYTAPARTTNSGTGLNIPTV